jgi:hypothetical protein
MGGGDFSELGCLLLRLAFSKQPMAILTAYKNRLKERKPSQKECGIYVQNLCTALERCARDADFGRIEEVLSKPGLDKRIYKKGVGLLARHGKRDILESLVKEGADQRLRILASEALRTPPPSSRDEDQTLVIIRKPRGNARKSGFAKRPIPFAKVVVLPAQKS